MTGTELENNSAGLPARTMNWVATHLGQRSALGGLLIGVGFFLGVEDPGENGSRYSQIKALAGMSFTLLGVVLVVVGYFLSKRKPTRVVVWVGTYSDHFSKNAIRSALSCDGSYWISIIALLKRQFSRHADDASKIEDLARNFAKKCASNKELFFGAIGHIPLIARLGYLLRDFSFQFFEVSHSSRAPVLLSEVADTNLEEVMLDITNLTRAEQIRVSVSVSFLIEKQTLPAATKNLPIAEIRLRQVQPSALRSQANLIKLKEEIATVLRKIQISSGAKKVHFFYAGPTSLIFLLAQGFHRNTNPEYLVYHYDNEQGYTWSLSINDSGLS